MLQCTTTKKVLLTHYNWLVHSSCFNIDVKEEGGLSERKAELICSKWSCCVSMATNCITRARLGTARDREIYGRGERKSFDMLFYN